MKGTVMGANFEHMIIVDPTLDMGNTEIAKQAQGYFEDERRMFGTEPYCGTLGQFFHVNIQRVDAFANEELAVDYASDMECNKFTQYAHVVPILNVGWLVGGWCSV